MTLILKRDLDIVKMYYHTTNGVSMSTALKGYSPNRHTQTDTQTRRKHYLYRVEEVNIWNLQVSYTSQYLV